MRLRVVCRLLVVFLLISSSLFSQVALNTGSIYGKVVDESGNPLPRVTIVLETTGITPKTAYSGESGLYRFSGLSPAMYILQFSLPGLVEVRQEDIEISSGSTVEVEVTLEKSVHEEVSVKAETPLLDTRKISTSSSYNQEYLTLVPTTRDPWSVVDQTPGVDVNAINVGGTNSGQQPFFIARGGTFSQNIYSYDGMDITPPSGGVPAYLNFGSFDEIQVTTGGIDPAVNSSGIVINFITKRGGNSWAGQINGYYTGHAFQANNVDEELKAKHFNSPTRINEAYDYGGDVGGPVIKDKAWIWGAYRYQKIADILSETIIHDTGGSLDGTITGGAPVAIELTNFNLKTNISYNDKQEGTFQFYRSQKKAFNRFFFPGSQEALNATDDQDGVDYLFKAEHNWSPNSKWFLNAKFAYLPGWYGFEPVAGRGASPVLRLNNDLYFEHGLFWLHINSPQKDLTFDGNRFVQHKLGGDHELKFGFAYKDSTVTGLSQYGGDVILYDFYGFRGDRSLGKGLAKLRYEYNNSAHDQTFGAYVGDTWRLDRLTLNLGTRFVASSVANNPTSAPANKVAPDLLPALFFDGKTPPVRFHNFSPRFGATFDVTGNGKTIVRGNYARFYDISDLFFASFQSPLGSDDLSYTGLYVYYADANGDGLITRDELLTQYGIYATRGMVVGDAQATADGFSKIRQIDPNFRSQSTDEYLAGFEHELFRDFSIGATYTHRKYDHIQDSYVPGVTAADYLCRPLTFEDLKTHQTFQTEFCQLPSSIPNQDAIVLVSTIGRTRSYDGLEVTVNKRMSNRWMMRVSGTIQTQKLHFINNGNTFGGSFQDPTNFTDTNGQWWASDSTGNLGSEWSFKASGAYGFPRDITVGVYFKAQNGYIVPITAGRSLGSYAEGQHRVLFAPPGTVRLPGVKYTDMQIEKAFELPNYGKLYFSVGVFNLFNINSIQAMNGRVGSFQFLEPTQIVNPRVFRLGLRYTF